MDDNGPEKAGSPGEAGNDDTLARLGDLLSPQIRRLIESGPTTSEGSTECGHCGATSRQRAQAGCHGAGWVEVFYEALGKEFSHRCPHEAAYHRRRRIARAAKTSGTGALGERQTFETFDTVRCASEKPREVAEILRNLSEDIDRPGAELEREHKGIFLMGDTGTGKSHLLRATTLEAIERGRTARYVECYRLVAQILDSYDAARGATSLPPDAERPKTRSQILNDIAEADIVCLDDLGAEQETEHTGQILFELLDRLETEQRILVASTNLKFNALRSRYGERIYARLSGLCSACDLSSERSQR